MNVLAVMSRNWPGILSVLLAMASIAIYWLATVVPPPNPYGAADLGQFLFFIFLTGTVTSALLGFLAMLRARRGRGGMATGVIGLLLGGTLTLMWVAWIGGLMLFPGALGGD